MKTLGTLYVGGAGVLIFYIRYGVLRLTVEVEDEAVLPELYRVQGEDVSVLYFTELSFILCMCNPNQVEYRAPGQAERVAAGRIPFMWAQSLYIISKLLLQVPH